MSTSAGFDKRLRPASSFGLHTANRCSVLRRTTSRPGQLPSPWRTARSTSSRAKSTCCRVADTRRSMLGWSSANRPRRLTSHLAAKSGRRADRQDAGTLPLQQALGADRNAIEGIAQDDQILPARVRDDKALALAIEELDPELRFQRFHLMAHRALGDAQLLGRPREALVACRGLEGLERIQRRKAAEHRSSLHEEN